MKTILWHLNLKGFRLDSKEIDVTLFYDYMNEIVGNMADEVVEDVYLNLQKEYSLHSGAQTPALLLRERFGGHHKSHSSANENEPVLDRIQQLLEAGNGGHHLNDEHNLADSDGLGGMK